MLKNLIGVALFLILFFAISTVPLASGYSAEVQEISESQELQRLPEATLSPIRAVEFVEYFSQWGEPYICDALQYLIDTDGYLYAAIFYFNYCYERGLYVGSAS